jgi:hypothetical protein
VAPTSPSLFAPAGILEAGKDYYFNLVYSDRIFTGGDIATTQFYDIGTTGYFSTASGAVPEPSTWAMLLTGFLGIGLVARRQATRLRAKAA